MLNAILALFSFNTPKMITPYAEYSVRNPKSVLGMWGLAVLGLLIFALTRMSGMAAANLKLIQEAAILSVICAVILLVVWRNLASVISCIVIMGLVLAYVMGVSALQRADLSISPPGLFCLIGLALSYAIFVNYGYITEVEKVTSSRDWVFEKRALLSDAMQKNRLPVIMGTIVAVISLASGLLLSSKEGIVLAVGAAMLGLAALTLVPAVVLMVVAPSYWPNSATIENNSLNLANELSRSSVNNPIFTLLVSLLALPLPLVIYLMYGPKNLPSATDPAILERYMIVALVAIVVVFTGLFKTHKLPLLSLLVLGVVLVVGYFSLGRIDSKWSGTPMMVMIAFCASHVACYLTNWFLYAKKCGQPSDKSMEQTWREAGRAMLLASFTLLLAAVATRFMGGNFQPWASSLLMITVTMLICDLLITPTLLGMVAFTLGIPTEKELEVLKGELDVAHMQEGQTDYTDDQLTRMPAYDLFTWAGKTIVRPASNNGTRRLFHLISPKPGQKVLEIGCGQGITSITLAKLSGAEVTGIDLNDFMIGQAKRNAAAMGVSNVIFQQGNATQLPFPDETFDIVFTEAVSMFITPSAIYNEANRVLKPGGIVAGDEFTWTKRPAPDLEKLTCVLACGVPGYFMYFYTLSEWHRHLQRAGFDVKISREYPFSYFTMKGMVDDEGIVGTVRIFWNMMTRMSALKRLVSIMYFFQKYEGWFSYVVFTAIKTSKKVKEVKQVEEEQSGLGHIQGKQLV